jgi:hypothetical protein
MPPRPFRIFVLDNDQTAGDYRALFYWIEWLRSSNLAPYVRRQQLVAPFISICEKSGILRPGLRALLRRLASLKMDGWLDYFVIYTNQTEILPLLLGADKEALNIPRLLADIYRRLAEDEDLVDLLLVRPHEYDESGLFLPKRYARIFEGLDINPRNWNARNTLFFDDIPAEYIYDDNVIGTGRSHVQVPAYIHTVDTGILLDLCLATLTVADGAPKEVLGKSYILLHDALLNFKMQQGEGMGKDGGGGLGPFMGRLSLYTQGY